MDNKKIIENYIFEYKRRVEDYKDILTYDNKYNDRSESLIELINSIETYIDNNMNEFNNLNNHLLKYIENLFENITIEFNYIDDNIRDDSWSIIPALNDLLINFNKDIRKIDYLHTIKNRVSIFIGKNGSGKSSFAGHLSESFSDNLVVIPAQKTLFVDLHPEDHNVSDKNIVDLLNNTNLIIENKSMPYNPSFYAIKDYIYKLNRDLQYSVAALVNMDIDQVYNRTISHEKTSIFNDFMDIWNVVVKDIDFKIDTYNRTLIPFKDDSKYDFNTLSDGEKSIVYFIIRVLLAPHESYIFIDEPDTHLNIYTMNILWEELENTRQDCKFIYITHNLDFIRHKNDCNIFWMKSYQHPDIWNIEDIDSGIGIPRSLLLEIVGNKLDVLFCEGTTSSMDYEIYSNLFYNDFKVVPVETSSNVINYTKIINENDMFNIRACGLIDNDLLPDERIKHYAQKNIFTTPFYEVEMILLTEEVLNDYYSLFEFDNSIFKSVDEVKSFIKNYAIENKQDILKELNTQKFINEIHNYFPKLRTSVIDDLKSNLLDYIESTITKDINNSIKIATDKLNSDDYNSILEILPFKNRIINEIGNKIDSGYKKKSINRIKLNKTLQNSLKIRYFKEINEYHFNT